MNGPDDAFQKLVLDAVRRCGWDVRAIEQYVAGRVQAMEPAERERITRDIHRLLAFHVPGMQESGPH